MQKCIKIMRDDYSYKKRLNTQDKIIIKIDLEVYTFGITNKGTCLRYLPFDDLNEASCLELIFMAIKNNGLALIYVPEKYKTIEFCLLAVQNHGFALSQVPKKHRTYEICLAAIKQNPKSIIYVPKKVVDNEMILIAIELNWKIMRLIPEKKINEKMFLVALAQSAQALFYINNPHFINLNSCKILYENHWNNLELCHPDVYHNYFYYKSIRLEKERYKRRKYQQLSQISKQIGNKSMLKKARRKINIKKHKTFPIDWTELGFKITRKICECMKEIKEKEIKEKQLCSDTKKLI